MALQVRAEMGSPWPTQSHQGFPAELIFKTWTSTGKIVAVWQSKAEQSTPGPIVKVYDAFCGMPEQTISLPRRAEGWAVGHHTGGGFRQQDIVLSPSQAVLAMAHDETWFHSGFVWLVDLRSGIVSHQEVRDIHHRSHVHKTFETLSFSSDSKVLAVTAAAAMDNFTGPAASFWLLSASSGLPIMSTGLVGRQAFSAPQVRAFILPLYRMVLFQGSCKSDDDEGYVLHHIPAVGSNGKYGEPHSHTRAALDPRWCSACNSMALDNGLLSADGSLFVTLGQEPAPLVPWQAV